MAFTAVAVVQQFDHFGIKATVIGGSRIPVVLAARRSVLFSFSLESAAFGSRLAVC